MKLNGAFVETAVLIALLVLVLTGSPALGGFAFALLLAADLSSGRIRR